MRSEKSVLYSLILCAALLSGAAFAQAQEDAASAAHRLVVRCGLSVQLRSIPQGFSEQSKQMRGQMPNTLIAALEEAGKEAFRPDLLQDEVERILAGSMKVAAMKQAIAWLETDVGRRVTLAEEVASVTMDEAALKKYAATAKAPSARRVKVLQDILGVTNGVETTATVMEAMALGVALGIDSTQPVQKRAGPALLRAQIRKAMPPEKIKEMVRQRMPGVFAYTYRDLSDADLAAYVDFLRGPAGKGYNDAMMEALSQALVAASMRMGQLLEPAGSKQPA
jgi:hypothetical protein